MYVPNWHGWVKDRNIDIPVGGEKIAVVLNDEYYMLTYGYFSHTDEKYDARWNIQIKSAGKHVMLEVSERDISLVESEQE